VYVKVIRVNPEERQIDFALAEETAENAKSRKRGT
jgi:translation initiation factor 2 alpha subunit (eIF-2alpha)